MELEEPIRQIAIKHRRRTCSSSSGGSAPSQAISSIGNTSSDDEEDMANCLILLAREPPKEVSRTTTTTTMTIQADPEEEGSRIHRSFAGKNGYECKTCNRSFPSFQALGGHRASHKRPKISSDRDDRAEKSSRRKLHECSICGAEFGSGQALGGHMRRHRASSAAAAATSASTGDSRRQEIFRLDLNLPAPEEEASSGESAYRDGSEDRSAAAFSGAGGLVDCQYYS